MSFASRFLAQIDFMTAKLRPRDGFSCESVQREDGVDESAWFSGPQPRYMSDLTNMHGFPEFERLKRQYELRRPRLHVDEPTDAKIEAQFVSWDFFLERTSVTIWTVWRGDYGRGWARTWYITMTCEVRHVMNMSRHDPVASGVVRQTKKMGSLDDFDCAQEMDRVTGASTT